MRRISINYLYLKKYKSIYSKYGLYYCQNGYLNFNRNDCKKENIYINGYFQSEHFFENQTNDIKSIFKTNEIKNDFLRIIQSTRNSVCLAMRFGDYINNLLHGVCNVQYYKNAIEIIKTKVENPFFFVFSNDLQMAYEILSNIRNILENQ